MRNAKKLIALATLLLCTASLFAMTGVVVSVVGKVEVLDGDDWVALKPGDELVPGSVISTGFKSEAVVKVGESAVTVRALTRLTVEQLFELDGDTATTMFLDAGSISASVRSVEDKRVAFKVKTPAVTASVRGTDGVVFIGRVEGYSGAWLLTEPEPRLSQHEIQQQVELQNTQIAQYEAEMQQREEQPARQEAQSAEEPSSSAAAEAPSEKPAQPFDDLFTPLSESNGILVHKDETAKVVANSGSFVVRTPQELAVQKATSFATSTTTLSQQEAVGRSSVTPKDAAAVNGSGLPTFTGDIDVDVYWEPSGSVQVNVQWPDNGTQNTAGQE